ncbi:Conserved_hypothetical protein [Hexamita inflata]|uniref:Uncharacterized protein n=1 Tax=Hexamita inflata TaxID=28002 RepID=A0AA86RQW1_9EUKA|nr:Conserved hypothetical protein [Hexamita inflata]
MEISITIVESQCTVSCIGVLSYADKISVFNLNNQPSLQIGSKALINITYEEAAKAFPDITPSQKASIMNRLININPTFDIIQVVSAVPNPKSKKVEDDVFVPLNTQMLDFSELYQKPDIIQTQIKMQEGLFTLQISFKYIEMIDGYFGNIQTNLVNVKPEFEQNGVKYGFQLQLTDSLKIRLNNGFNNQKLADIKDQIVETSQKKDEFQDLRSSRINLPINNTQKYLEFPNFSQANIESYVALQQLTQLYVNQIEQFLNKKIVQEPFELFILTKKNIRCSEVIIFIPKCEIQHLNCAKVVIEIEQPLLLRAQNVKDSKDKKVEPNQFGVSKYQVQNAEQNLDGANLKFYTEVNLLKLLEPTCQHFEEYSEQPLIPFDQNIFGKMFNMQPVVQNTKDKKKSDNQLSYIYTNSLLGTQKLIEIIKQQKLPGFDNMEKISILQQKLQQFEEQKSIQSLQSLYKTLYGLTSMPQVFNQKWFQVPSFVLTMNFSDPLNFKLINIDSSIIECTTQNEEITNQLNVSQLGDDLIKSLDERTRHFYRQLEDRYITQITPHKDDKQVLNRSVMLEQRQKTKAVIQKQFALTGIQGNIKKKHSNMITKPKITKGQNALNNDEFQGIIAAEGYADGLRRQIQPLLEKIATFGFENQTELLGKIVQVVEKVEQNLIETNELHHKVKEASPVRQQVNTGSTMRSLMTPTILAQIANQQDDEESSEDIEKIDEDFRHTAAMVSRAVQLTITGQHHYINLAFEQVMATIAKYEFTDINQLFEKFRKCDMRRLITILMYTGFRLSQPHTICSQDDDERIIKYLKSPVQFIVSALDEDYELNSPYISSESAILATAQILTDKMMIPDNGNNGKVKKQLNNLNIETLITKILEDSDDLALFYLNNHLRISKDKWKQADQKQEILSQLNKNLYKYDDIQSIFENMDMVQQRKGPETTFNTLLQTKMELQVDETGKRIKQQDLEEAQKKQIQYVLSSPPLWVITTFLFVLYENKFITAKLVDSILKQYISNTFKKHYKKFQSQIKELEQNKEENESVQVVTSDGNKQNSNQVQLLNKFQRNCQRLQQNPLCKHTSYTHLLAVQDHLVNGQVQIDHIIPSLNNFQSDDEYMNFILQSTNPEQNLKEDLIILCSHLTLAEWLTMRGETIISELVVNKIKTFVKDLPDTPLYQHEILRHHILEMRRLSQQNNFDAVLAYGDAIKEQSGLVFVRLKSFGAFNLLRAKAYHELNKERNSMFVRLQTSEDIEKEIVRNAYAAYVNTLKTNKEYNDFLKGSTSIGDAGFFDVEFGYSLVEVMFCNLNLLNQVHQTYLPDHLKNKFMIEKLKSVQDTTQTTNSVDFLKNTLTPMMQPSNLLSARLDQYLENSTMGSARPLGVMTPDDFKRKKQDIKTQNIHENKDILLTTKTKQIVPDQPEKDQFKQIVSLANASKLLLDQVPGFGPSWALFSLIQLAMGNVAEARLSSSMSTLLCPQAVETWVAWCTCELYNAVNTGTGLEMIAEFLEQIEAMGLEGSNIDFIWDDIKVISKELKM